MFLSRLRPDAGYFEVLIFCSLSVLIGCQGAQRNDQRPPYNDQRPPYIEAFSDFVFVGSGVHESRNAVAPHGMEEKLLPSQLNTGYQYIFHLPRSKQKEDVYNTLLTRLKSSGVRITSSRIYALKYIGEPGFYIIFQWDGYEGTIFNKLDNRIVSNDALVAKWCDDDFILVLEKA